MTAKQIVDIEKHIANSLPRFGVASKKKLLVLQPARFLLRGVTMYGSGFSKTTLYCDYFVMPLFVRRDYLTLTYGSRTKPGDWDSTQPDVIPKLVEAIRDQALPFLDKFQDVSDFVDLKLGNPQEDLNKLRELSYALVILDQGTEALKAIDKGLGLRGRPELRQWELEIIEEMADFKELLQGDLCAAKQQLKEWGDYTVGQLNLEAFR